MNLKGCRAGGTYSPRACRGKLSRWRGHGKSTTIGLACRSCPTWVIRDRVEPGRRFGHVCYALKAEAKSDYRAAMETLPVDFPLLGFKPPSSDGDWLEP
jgi:hypothetical protein